MMKKVRGLLAALTLMFTLSACGAPNPSDTVENAIKHLQNNEVSEAKQYFYTDSDEEKESEQQSHSNSDESDLYSQVFIEALGTYAEENAQFIEYEIIDTTTNDDNSVVTVEITYKNAGPVIKLAITDLINQSVSSAFSSAFLGGEELNDEDMTAIFLASFEKAKENAAVIDKTDTLKIHCEKVNNEWKITDYDKLFNVYYCNIYDTMNSMFSSDENDAIKEEEPEVPVESETASEEESGISAETKSDSDISYFKDNGLEDTIMSFATWDEFNQMTITLTYIGEDSNGQYVGTAEAFVSTYDEETGEEDSATGSGTLIEDSEGNGVITLDNGNVSDYYIYWDDDHYVLSINIDGDIMTLLEAEWAYNNVG